MKTGEKMVDAMYSRFVAEDILRHVSAEDLAELRAMAREVIDFWAAAETGPRGLHKAPGAPKKGRDNVH